MTCRAKWNSICRRTLRLRWLLVWIGCTATSISLFTASNPGTWKNAREFVQGIFLLVAVAIGIAMIAFVIAAWPVRGWFAPPHKWTR